jgi:hypothetical protein
VSDRRAAITRTLLDLAAVALVLAAVAAVGFALTVWTGFPKGTDAYSHLTRLQFVAEFFPRHEWLYAWAAGMPTFESYPELPYIAAAPVTKLLGAPVALVLIAATGMALLGVGLYGTVRTATRSSVAGLVAALGAIGSMATWTWIVNGGVYARVLAAGLAACACWAAARWLGGGGRVAFAITALLLAAAIASHQFVGAVFAFGIGVAALTHPGPGKLRRAATLTLATFLLASPAVVPPLVRYGGFASTFLGVDKPQLTSALSVMVDPLHIGIAVVPLVIMTLIAAWPPRRAVILLLVALTAWVGYLFAPTVGIPTRFYYVTGIEPFTITFLVAVVAALAGGFALGIARGAPIAAWRRHGAAALAIALVTLNLWLGPSALLASNGYPHVEDTSAPASIEDLARRTIVVNGEDISHRFLPAIASESVWFSYVYAKPQLRDYYGTGQVHPDWLAWANAAIYTAPFHEGRFRAALDWFGIDSFTVFDDPNFTGNVERFERSDLVRRVAVSDPPIYKQYAVSNPSALWRPTNARLLVVVGGREEYDTVARMTLDRGARPGTLIPIWWQDTADHIPNDLLERAQAVIVEDGRFGDRAAADRSLASYAMGGGRVLLDARGSSSALSELWPVEGATDEAIGEWRLHASSASLRVQDFAPARYDDGPWGAPVGTALRGDARVFLDQDGRPLVAERTAGKGAIVWVGGNLLYHAKAYSNDVESEFLVGLLGPLGRDASVSGEANRLDAERATVHAFGASGVFVSESYHPKWTARWSDGSALSVYYAGPGLTYVPTPSSDGTLTLEFGRTWTDYGVWVLAVLGLFVCVWRRTAGSANAT